jgi:hypothetical protein
MENFEMSMRDKIAQRLAAADRDQRPYPETAAAILEALPDMIAPLVWEVRGSYGKNEYTSGLYTIRASVLWVHEAGGTNIRTYTGYNSLNEAKHEANTHHRAAIMAAFTGETQ